MSKKLKWTKCDGQSPYWESDCGDFTIHKSPSMFTSEDVYTLHVKMKEHPSIAKGWIMMVGPECESLKKAKKLAEYLRFGT